ncbi:acyl carrier protein [Microbispora sp. NEAU-D428]|uniref:acyl carrier protein n=1 Tax=Microbispora sitophila TaxID=2771537 RepID=UPI0018670D93|nr:acyl carrier protein [Microbispora sitophila]MBE3012127.1 acyl carrier protein [Microbispora sitophila]
MNRHQIAEQVRHLIRAQCASLEIDEVSEDASLTYDLGMDSLQIGSLIAAIREEIADIEFSPWYIDSGWNGQDTVGGLTDYIAERAVRTPAQVTGDVS